MKILTVSRIQKENIVITDKNSSRIWTLLYKDGIWSLEPGK